MNKVHIRLQIRIEIRIKFDQSKQSFLNLILIFFRYMMTKIIVLEISFSIIQKICM